MSATLTIENTGLFTLEIPDAAGEVWTYRIVAAPPGLGVWAVQVTRTDTDDSYKVTEEGSGRWRCSCPDWTYAKPRRDCKHVTAVRGLRALVRALT